MMGVGRHNETHREEKKAYKKIHSYQDGADIPHCYGFAVSEADPLHSEAAVLYRLW